MADSNWSVRIGTRVTDDIQKQLDTMPKKTVTVKAVLDNTGLKTIGTTELTKYEDALGNVVVANKKFDASGKELTNTIKSVKSTVDTTSQTLQTASKHTKTLGQDFVETAGKVAKFGAITAIFGLVTTAISEATSSVKELDASLTELKKVTDLSGDSLQNYTEQAFSMARDLKSTASDVTDAITEFAKSNYTLEESQVLARQAIIFQTIADGAITASDSATMLIQVMKAYNMTVAESEHIVNAINEVSNNYALSSTDLSNSIGKVASSAKTAGVDFESLLGLMTAGTEVTQDASKTANGLKSILVNLISDKLSDQFKEFGIDMRDSNGAMKDGYTILQELSDAYNNMELVADETGESLITTNDNMNKLLEDLGGKYNINTLTAILGNFGNAINATESAFDSANSASDEYAKAMDSIAKKSDAVKGAFQELVWGDGGLSSFIKSILDGTTGILKFANDTKALNVVLTDLAIILAIKLIPSMLSTTVTLINMATTAIPRAISAWQLYMGVAKGAEGTSIALGTAMRASIPLIGLVMVALSGMVMAHNKVKAKQEELARLSDEQSKKLSREAILIQDKLKKISDETTSREQLVDAIKSVSAAYDDEKLAQKDINELRQEGIDLLSEESKERANASLLQMSSDINEANMGLTGTGENFKTGGVEGVNPSDYFQYSSAQTYGKGKFFYGSDLAGTVSGLEAYGTALREVLNDSSTAASQQQEIQKELNKVSEKYTELKSNLDTYNETKERESKLNAIISGTYKESTEAQEEQNRATSEAIKRKKESADAYKELIDGFSDIQSSYDTLSTAMNEYNENGTYSLDTVSKLLSLDSEYLSMLQLVNGQMTINEEAIRNKVIAQAEEAKQEIYSTAIAELNAIASGKTAEATDTLATKKSSSSIDIAKQTTSLSENNYQLAINNALQAQGQESQGAVNDVIKRTTDSINAINTAVSGMGVSFEGSMGKATKATKTQTKAIDKQREALNKLKDEYKAVTKYIEDQLDSEISRIKDAKSAELDRVDAIIDALNKRKDAELESIDSTIDALDKRKDTELESIDSTIDALNKKRDAEKEYWDNRISALKAQNDATEKQIALEQLQQNLALARNKKVMVMGANGWEVRSDESAISQAEQDIANYNRKQQAQTEIDILNKLKTEAISSYTSRIQAQKEFRDRQKATYDSQIQAQEEFRAQQESNYDSQIQAQEEFRDRQEATYDSQIKVIEGYKTEYNNMINAYEKDQNRLIALQVLGTDFENQTWQARLANLQSYVNRYNSLQASLSSSVANTSSESEKTVKKPPSVPTTEKTTPTIKRKGVGRGATGIGADGRGATGIGGVGRGATVGSVGGGAGSVKGAGRGTSVVSSTALSHKARGYASGVASVSSNEIAMIGDSPSNRELVIGSKLNGTATMLSQGSGVVNAQSTKSLAGILNTLGSSMGLNGQTMGMNTTNQSNATSQSIQIANITLPSVTNGQGLLDELRGFASGMLQTSYSNA